MGNFIEEIIERDLADGKVKTVITRFPPEPNGYLHIGHAKAIFVDYGMAVKYGGKFNLRFDDTNPSKEDDEYVQSIIEDVKWLGAKFDNIFFASDYFETMYEKAVLLINKGLAYVDDVTPEEMKNMRGTLTEPGKESKFRNRPIAESLKLFEEMRAGKYADGELVLRAKIDMASPNMNMRDPIIYRVLHASHHRQGNKWCIYPMYDFAHPLEDAIEGVSHSLCTLEFEDHRPLYDWFIEKCEFQYPPHQYEFARLNLERTIMSKRYLKKLVDEGTVDGWDDPRMPTIAGLRRRGYTPSSLKKFCDDIGVAKANSEVAAAQLESCIRDELNANADRAMAVLDPIELIITNRPEDFREELDIENGTSPDAGTRKVTMSRKLFIEREDFKPVPPPKYKRFTVGGTVRLKGAYIIECESFEADENGEVTRVFAHIIEGTHSGENSPVKTKGVIHWVDAQNCVDIECRNYDYLLVGGDTKLDFSQRLNDRSLEVVLAKGEKMLQNAHLGKSYQFLRQGYYCRDVKSEGLVFNRIVSLKEGYKL